MRVLSKKEIKQITGRTQRNKQTEALRMMKIDHRVNPDGDVIVVDSDLPLTDRKPEPTISLNLDAA